MSVSKLPDFTPEAANVWNTIPKTLKQQFITNVFCSKCRGTVKVTDFKGIMKGRDLILKGYCAECGNAVARMIEG
jgi:hypothetical protein